MRMVKWRSRYDATIDILRETPFEWGDHDCLFGLVVPVIEALTGDRMFERFRGRYRTAKGALGVMRKAGYADLADLAASELPEVHPSACVLGDIVAIPSGDDFGFALGVVNGDRVFILHPGGLGQRSLSEAVRAFKVS
jgi:hypothetical protein